MDPNETLARLRAAVATYWTSTDQAELDNAAETVILAAADLDSWLTRGGFLPTEWTAPAPVGAPR